MLHAKKQIRRLFSQGITGAAVGRNRLLEFAGNPDFLAYSGLECSWQGFKSLNIFSDAHQSSVA